MDIYIHMVYTEREDVFLTQRRYGSHLKKREAGSSTERRAAVGKLLLKELRTQHIHNLR